MYGTLGIPNSIYLPSSSKSHHSPSTHTTIHNIYLQHTYFKLITAHGGARGHTREPRAADQEEAVKRQTKILVPILTTPRRRQHTKTINMPASHSSAKLAKALKLVLAILLVANLLRHGSIVHDYFEEGTPTSKTSLFSRDDNSSSWRPFAFQNPQKCEINAELTKFLAEEVRIGWGTKNGEAPTWMEAICPEVVEHFNRFPMFNETPTFSEKKIDFPFHTTKAMAHAVCTLKVTQILAASVGAELLVYAGSQLGAVRHGQPASSLFYFSRHCIYLQTSYKRTVKA
jgi:hypothetical protein